MTLLAGHLWRYLGQAAAEGRLTKWDTRWIMVHTSLACIAALAVPVIMFKFGVSHRLLSASTGIAWSVFFVLTAAVLLILGIKKAVIKILAGSLILICLINASVLPVFYRSPIYDRHREDHPLRSIRQIDALNGLKLYSLGELHIQLIWDVGKTVRPWDIQNDPLPGENTPFGLISKVDPRPLIPDDCLDKVDITLLEKFPYRSKQPDAAFYITLISPKPRSQGDNKRCDRTHYRPNCRYTERVCRAMRSAVNWAACTNPLRIMSAHRESSVMIFASPEAISST
jgi:hypothetical protein